MYPYITPHGYGDTFFIYAMNGEEGVEWGHAAPRYGYSTE